MDDDEIKDTIPTKRIAVIGCKGCGKTSLIQRFIGNCLTSPMENALKPTFGPVTKDPRVYSKLVCLNPDPVDSSFCYIQLEEIPGVDDPKLLSMKPCVDYILKVWENKAIKNPRVKGLVSNQEKPFYGYIFVVDPTSLKKIQVMEDVIREIKKMEKEAVVGKGPKLEPIKFLVLNKNDLLQQPEPFGQKDHGEGKRIRDLATKEKLELCEVSALANKDVNSMFDKMVKAIGFSPGITVFEQNLELESQSKGRDVSKKAGKAQMDEKKEKKRPRCCGGVFSGNKGINQDTKNKKLSKYDQKYLETLPDYNSKKLYESKSGANNTNKDDNCQLF